MSIYILSAAQISIQAPLSEQWFDMPKNYSQPHVRAIDPDYKAFINPIAARRMSPIIKRALATAKTALTAANLEKTDAIICGTGWGCVENTEKFLNAMVFNGEQLLQPTHFVQSTHNTVAAQIALTTQCNGYNNTFIHYGISFESALFDAVMQFRLGEAETILVGGSDEITSEKFEITQKTQYFRNKIDNTLTVHKQRAIGAFCGEGSTSLILGLTPTANALAQLKNVELLHLPTQKKLSEKINDLLQENNLVINDIDAVFLGINGDKENDEIYDSLIDQNFANTPICIYKNMSGEYYTAPAFGVYAAAHCIKQSRIPDTLCISNLRSKKCDNVLLINHYKNKDYSLILLSKC